MKRRDLLGAGLALTGAALAPAAAKAAAVSRVRPGGPGWPSDADWEGLKKATGGRLSPVTVPDLTGPDHVEVIAAELQKRGQTSAVIEKVLGANFQRVIGEIWGMA